MANAFIGQAEQPTSQALANALGPAKAAWDELLAELVQECGANVQEWKSYSLKTGWSLRVKRKQRTIVWLAPATNSFTVLFILGEKAVRAARQSQLSKPALALLDEAPRYPEGTGVRLEVKTCDDLESCRKLAQIKLLN